MALGRGTRRIMSQAALLVVFLLLMTACNLGQQAPSEPITNEPAQPQDVPAQGATATPLIQVPPTDTPVPQLLPSEQISAIAIDGTEHRALEQVTIRVRRGTAVSSLTCSWTLQDTGQTAPLGAAASSTQVDGNTFEDVFRFTPDTGGTFVVRCNGQAATASGVRIVEGSSAPFTVQQKG